MKFKIRQPEPIPIEGEEQTLICWLNIGIGGNLSLLCQEEGEEIDCGEIITIDAKTRKLHRSVMINPALGLSLDSARRIEIEN